MEVGEVSYCLALAVVLWLAIVVQIVRTKRSGRELEQCFKQIDRRAAELCELCREVAEEMKRENDNSRMVSAAVASNSRSVAGQHRGVLDA